MTSDSTTRSPSIDGHHGVRLRLKPRGPATGFVDGGWWPRSHDLPAELAALSAVLAVRMGPVESVSYNLDTWGSAPRRIILDGRLVRLAGYRSQHPATVDVLGAAHRVTLLVIAPDAAPGAAHAALMAAGRRGSTDSVEVLLAGSGADATEAEPDDVAAQQRWDLDGGHVPGGGFQLVRASHS